MKSISSVKLPHSGLENAHDVYAVRKLKTTAMAIVLKVILVCTYIVWIKEARRFQSQNL